MVKLKRLKILKYRNVRPGTELRFDDGFNLVLGKNGSGKTTLLGLLTMCCGWNFSTLADEEFSVEFDLTDELRNWRCRLENTRESSDPDTLLYHYSIQGLFPDSPDTYIEGAPSANYVIETNGTKSRQHTPLSPFSSRFLDRLASNLHNIESTEEFLPAIWLVPHEALPARFDEALGYFYGLTGQTAPAIGAGGLATVRTIVRRTVDAESTRLRYRDHNPHRISASILDELLPTKQVSPTIPWVLPSAAVTWLRRFVEVAGFLDGSVVVNLESSSPPAINLVDLEVAGFSFFLIQIGGATIQHDRLSYGQKRLLAFHYYLANADSVVIADELVNGLHHRWIEVCMAAIGDRQAFLTSQNPLLFDYIPDFESPEQVQSRFITCRTETVDGAEQLVWDNLSDEQAAVFFSAYQAEIEPVGEILLTRGLW